jgi:very-short-patch-repair endonuclease
LLENRFMGTVGVVTPFRAQANYIQHLLTTHQDLRDAALHCDLVVDTVHKFQGDERDVIVFSPVISGDAPASALSFLRNNANLFNVAITRARALLHVVGDASATQACDVEYLSKFSQYARSLQTPTVAPVSTQLDLGPVFPAVPHPENVSPWETALYEALYAAGIQPIPQYPVEEYDLDFAVMVGRRKLNIEVDGDKYRRSWTREQGLRDQLRSQRLIELGWEVKRFWVYEINDRLSECVEQIKAWVQAPR